MSTLAETFRPAAGSRYPEHVLATWAAGLERGDLAICDDPALAGAPILFGAYEAEGYGRVLHAEAMAGRLTVKPGAARVAAVLDDLARGYDCRAVDFFTSRPGAVRLFRSQGFSVDLMRLTREVRHG